MIWSHSLHQAVRSCERRAFLTNHYARPGRADAERRRAWLLKQAQNGPLWVGSVIHSVLAQHFVPSLAAPPRLAAAALTDAAVAVGRAQLAFSSAGRFNEEGVTKSSIGSTFCVLEWDLVPGRERPADPLADLAAVAAGCFENLEEPFLAPLLHRLESSRLFAEQRVSFRIGPYTATATLDVLARRGDRRQVVDWKISGSATADNAFQLDTYALALTKTGAEAGNVDVAEVNLLTGALRERTPSFSDLERTENRIRASAAALRSLDPGDEQDLARFAAGLLVTDNPSSCAYCAMQPLCVDLESVDRYQLPAAQGRFALL